MSRGELRHGEYHQNRGVWIRLATAFRDHSRPALFLDRDGVIVEERNYLREPESVMLIESAAETIRYANREGVPVVIVTNQAGIGRGYYDWHAFEAVDREISRRLNEREAKIDAVLACPFHPEGKNPWRHQEHPARKPRPGMLFAAAELLNLRLSESWIVGDHSTDIEAGRAAGLFGGLHVLTGHGLRERAIVTGLSMAGFQLLLGSSIADAQPLIASLARIGSSSEGTPDFSK